MLQTVLLLCELFTLPFEHPVVAGFGLSADAPAISDGLIDLFGTGESQSELSRSNRQTVAFGQLDVFPDGAVVQPGAVTELFERRAVRKATSRDLRSLWSSFLANDFWW